MRVLVFSLALLAAGCGPASGDPAAPDAPTDPGPSPEAAASVPAGVDVPDGMVYVPGGTTRIGVLDGEAGLDHERPAFAADVSALVLDRSPVTVARFRAFAEATGHTTDAERFGDGAVMTTSDGSWALIPGADWRRPTGPAGPLAPEDHPVTQVSWTDAEAFCEWDGKRLPTEIEWEHAARGAVDDRSPYAWGDDLLVDGELQANTWTGTFPGGDDGRDGYAGGTSAVGTFGRSALGLTDMGGTVWEWTDSWYRSYSDREAPVSASPEAERVQRGGSFLCNPSYCHGYRVSARSHSTPESSLYHVGFRCARGAE